MEKLEGKCLKNLPFAGVGALALSHKWQIAE